MFRGNTCTLAVLLFLLALSIPDVAFAQVSVTTWHNDLSRTGQNLSETILTPSNVNSATFGKKCSYPVDGQVYAQPLYVPGVNVGGSTHNVLYAATEHDSVYAFDADCRQQAALWHVSFLGKGITPMPCTRNSQPQCDMTIMAPEHGISATPAIDAIANVIFVSAQTVENGVYAQKLHVLDIRNGAELPGSPVIIQATAPTNPKNVFDPAWELQRPGLALVDGVVYLAYSGNDYKSGWLIGYNATTLQQQGVFCVTPGGQEGGIWAGGAAPAADDTGMIYFTTGNGAFDADRGGPNYSMSAVKVAPGSPITPVDYFAPTNEGALSRKDLDLGSGGLMVLPDQAGDNPHEAVMGTKTGQVSLLNRDNMGHRNTNNLLQHFNADSSGFWSSPAYWNGNVYFIGVSGAVNQWTLLNGKFPVHPTHSNKSIQYSYPGATPSISANGSQDAILWAIETQGFVRGGPPAVLHAYDASDVSTELYSSKQAGKRDVPGSAVKFTVPTIADGKVFIGTQTDVDVYGLLK